MYDSVQLTPANSKGCHQTISGVSNAPAIGEPGMSQTLLSFSGQLAEPEKYTKISSQHET
jgi:hypothetical protein